MGKSLFGELRLFAARAFPQRWPTNGLVGLPLYLGRLRGGGYLGLTCRLHAITALRLHLQITFGTSHARLLELA